jgi:hypothetical protein
MSFWEKIKKDLQRGVKEGITAVKERATVVKEKMEKLSEEGKRQYRIFALKSKVQKEIADLGGRVYDLSSKIKNPLLDRKVKAIVSRIKKLETNFFLKIKKN